VLIPRRPVAPRTAWLVYRAGFGFALYTAVTTFTLRVIDRLDAGPLMLALLGTTLEVTYTLADVPTGALADRHSRKLSVLVGLVLIGLAMVLTAGPWLATVLVGAVVSGLGWTFTSGADVAWITDEVGEDAARPLYASGQTAELLGSLGGIAFGAGLGQIDLAVPLLASGGVFAVLALWLLLRMPEDAPHRHPEDRPTLAESIRRTRAQVKRRRSIAVLLLVMVALGFGGEGMDRLWQLHLLGDEAREGSAVLTVALLFAGGLVLGAVISAVVERRIGDDDPRSIRRWLAWTNGGVALAVLALALGPVWLAATAVVIGGGLRHVAYPLVQAWANRGADPGTRATLNSLVLQAESVGEIGGGPVLGAIGAATGVASALVTSAVVFAAGGVLSVSGPSDDEAVAGAPPSTSELGAGTAA
jgi:MFS transporter, DHA3 family, tetracycline resistance protein